MSQRSPTQTYGLIGLLLIVTAFVIWGFVIPQLRKSTGQQTIQNVTETPVRQQENPALPTGESAMPRP